MKSLLAAALSSAALIASPVVLAQASGTGPSGPASGGEGAGTLAPSTPHPPLTPSQTETSEGVVTNPPPIVPGGAPHVSERGGKVPGGDGPSGTAPGASGNTGNDAGSGMGSGGANGAGSGAGGSTDGGAGAGGQGGAGSGGGR